MFDREGFIEYVGEKSGNSYASGLGRIEKLFSVDIDAEYSKDKCEALLAHIVNEKQHLNPKEAKRFSDAASHLKRYITFRMNAVDTVTDRILFVIDHYKANFGAVNKDEHYKWEALGWYKKHWNIDAEDFADMLTNAFSKTANLLSSGMYYPYKMITEYAQADPEEVRRIFKLLHNEDIPLAERYHLFRDSCKARIDQIMNEQPGREKALNHYQDLRAVMVYLTFEYPEKYYLFKSTMYSDFRDRIGFREEKTNQSSVIGKVDNFFRMCDMVLEEVKMDQELIAMHKSRLDEDCYSDDALHLLTMDIVYYGSNYMSEEDFKKRPITKTETTYWPSLEEYNPGITKDMWVAVLSDPSITTPENLDMLRKMLELGGESTCAHLAEVYGKTHSYYNKLGSSYGEKVKKRFNCPDCPDRESDTIERNRVYVIPFVGRYVTENGNRRYSWKLRDELKEALMSIDIPNPEPEEETTTDIGLNTILYGPPGTGKTYHTVIYAVAIIENKELATVEAEDYAEVLERYNEYKTQGRIEFTTFHQSYGYEEFIEGIKPVIFLAEESVGEAGEIRYSVQSGVFKKFCEKSDAWDTFKKCSDKHYADVKKNNNQFISGDIELSIPEEHDEDTLFGDDELFKEWCNPTTVTSGFSEPDLHKLESIKAVLCELKKHYNLPEHPQPTGNYVFIIDEINRGNISKIFGELITLIESTKRLGQSEGMSVRLPYSQKLFGVPKNVYIIGTMNTADRSIATIDTALRRRFLFREMLPVPKVLSDISVEDLSISDLLTRLNKRIAVLYDREHTIGHAYFMPLKASPTIDTLAEIFANNIIPLLQEYFYEDYEKIRLVLGDNRKSATEEQFIIARENNYAELFGDADIGLDDGCSYEINYAALKNIEAYRSI